MKENGWEKENEEESTDGETCSSPFVYTAKNHLLIFLHSKRHLFCCTQWPNHQSDHLYDHQSDYLEDHLYDNLYDHLLNNLSG